MAFGKRQAGVGAAAQTFGGGGAGARSQDSTERRPIGGSLRWLIMFVGCGALLYGLISSYGSDILRDHRLAGTWQPAYDLRATDGKCERTNFVVTRCNVKINSVARPDQAPIEHHFLMLFSSGAGESLAPVRSTKDRAAVTIFYSAETKLWNRTLSFIFSALLVSLFGLVAIFLFLRADLSPEPNS